MKKLPASTGYFNKEMLDILNRDEKKSNKKSTKKTRKGSKKSK